MGPSSSSICSRRGEACLAPMSHRGTETRRACLYVSLRLGVCVAHCRQPMSRPESEAQDEHTEHTAHGVQRQLLGTAKGASARTSAKNQHANESFAPDLKPCHSARR